MTRDEETFSFGNQAFLSFASANTKEVVRFAYVYQRLQQPLCDILMQNKDSAQSPPQALRSQTLFTGTQLLDHSDLEAHLSPLSHSHH
ncbi:dnaJ homolog subfamily C member 16-like [Seriola lalandi dorsalis]|uniref:dnaJ homolog subfamily C member 16-like n=1 Tax=Seriola lalandi dorsalis TaxID=1841481 RepID=UPI000C6F7E3A|nr:dnaJ homolog subfamily C member 16-like [Seriola lalandi dorsalis]